MRFGNGVPWKAYTSPPVSEEQIRAQASWFLVLAAASTSSASVWELDDTTGGFPTGQGRSGTSGASDVRLGGETYVFPVKRAPKALFDFVAVGRHEGNDIWLPDPSVSRFHAFLRDVEGGLVVHDARSGNGTFLKGVSVPTQNAGPPLAVASGDPIRFGEVQGVVVDAAGLAARIHAGR